MQNKNAFQQDAYRLLQWPSEEGGVSAPMPQCMLGYTGGVYPNACWDIQVGGCLPRGVCPNACWDTHPM